MKRRMVQLSLMILMSLAACRTNPSVQVTSAWARPGFKGESTAVYFQIRNPLDRADALVRVQTEIAKKPEIHESMVGSHDTMHMQMQPTLEVPGNTTVELAPGGYHIMLLGLTQDLRPVDSFTLRLTFEKSGEISVPVTVEQP